MKVKGDARLIKPSTTTLAVYTLLDPILAPAVSAAARRPGLVEGVWSSRVTQTMLYTG